MVRTILRLEAVAVLLFSLYFYGITGGNWILFIVLLFVPDVLLLGYLKGKKFGATLYNLGHNYVLTVVVIFCGIFFSAPIVIHLGLILSVHVSMDRFLGFGLKYQTDFKATHIQNM